MVVFAMPRWGYAEYRAGSWWHSFQWLHNIGSICVWMQSHLGLICQRYTSNSDVTQITLGFFFLFPPSLFLKVSCPTWKNLLVFRSWEMQIIWGGKRQRDGEKRGQKKKNETQMWKYNETDERETRGNKGRQEERHYSNDFRGFCLHGCDVTHRQSMFWSERLTHTRRAFFCVR